MIYFKSIAIDGPAGAGKTTVAKALAKELGFMYVDTGAMYRTIALYMKNNHLGMDCLNNIDEILRKMDMKVIRSGQSGDQRMFIGDDDVSDLIRTEEIGKFASDISKNPLVRKEMTELQRTMAGLTNVVMEGRDITSVVLPNATLKVFLTAMPEERATRRMLQTARPKEEFNQILYELKVRDEQDMNRPVAPLRSDMSDLIVDSTGMPITNVIQIIKTEFKKR